MRRPFQWAPIVNNLDEGYFGEYVRGKFYSTAMFDEAKSTN